MLTPNDKRELRDHWTGLCTDEQRQRVNLSCGLFTPAKKEVFENLLAKESLAGGTVTEALISKRDENDNLLFVGQVTLDKPRLVVAKINSDYSGAEIICDEVCPTETV